mgnify:CR=1 FL=1
MGLNDFFEYFISKTSIFANKAALTSEHMPEKILFRDKEIEALAKALAPSLRCEKVSNIFIYGKTGTGKTLVANHVTNHLKQVAAKAGIGLKVIYLNCKLKRIADTEYRFLAQLCKEIGIEVPVTGLPTEELYSIFFNKIDKEKISFIIIIDEIDHLIYKTGDSLLYNLTRSNLKNSNISIIGISNDLVFTQWLDPRVKSSLNEEEIVFTSYNAEQLKEILKERAKIAFRADALSEGVIAKCAAIAAKEHGDARRALELLRLAGEIAERENKNKVSLEHVDLAQIAIEKDHLFEVINSQPLHSKIVLYSAIQCAKTGSIFTGELYLKYLEICKQIGQRPLTQRRVADLIAELDMLGILVAKVVSKGRYGRTREIALAINPQLAERIKRELASSMQ